MEPLRPLEIPDIKGYKNLRLIRAQGGMSHVYRGTRIETGQEVIIKLMPAPEDELEAQELQRQFNQEILIARLSTSEHLLAAIDHGDFPIYGSDEPRFYLVYPYIEYGSLADLLAFDRPWETWELPHIADIIAQAAEGLFHLHKSGIVHQDVKPNNFLWMPTDSVHNPLRRIHVWLIDFGAAEPERKGKTREIKGTLEYLAPEQLRGDIKYSVDQYALALLARLLLTGYEPPTTNEQTSLLYTQPTNLNPLRLSEPEIDNVLFKALAPYPEDRFPSVIEFAQSLQNAILKQIRQNPYTAIPNPSEASSVDVWAAPHTNSPSLPPNSLGVWAAPHTDSPSLPPNSLGVWAAPHTDSPSLPPQAQSAPPRWNEISTQKPIPVTPKELIYLPPLNPPKRYQPPLPRDGSQSRTAPLNKRAGPSLPFMLAHKWHTVKLPSTPRMLTWSPNGTELVCTFYEDLPLLINVKQSVDTLHSFAQGHSACWSPDSRFLAFSMHDENNPQAEIRFCDRTIPKNRNRLLCFQQPEPIRGLDWSRRGFFAIWLDRQLLVYDLSKIWARKHLPEPSYTLSLGDNMYCDQLTTLRWSPNGEWLAAGSNNGQIVCWQPHTGRYFKQQPLKKNIRSISWSPDGRILIVACANKQVLFWDLQTGRISQAELPATPRMVSISPQTGQIAIATEKMLFFFERINDLLPTAMHPGRLYAAFSPENKIATLDQDDSNELVIWQI